MVLEIAGKELRLKFGLHLGEMLVSEAAGKAKIGTLQFMAMLIFYAHENYCLGHDTPPVMTKGQLFEFLEENNNDNDLALKLQGVLKAYNESKPGQTINEAATVSKKKALAGKK